MRRLFPPALCKTMTGSSFLVLFLTFASLAVPLIADEAPPPPPPPDAVAPALSSDVIERRMPSIHTHGESSSQQHRAQLNASSSQPEEKPGIIGVLRHDFMRSGLLVGMMVAAACAYIGLYVVLKRVVFMGIALAEVSSAGVALGLALGFDPIIGSIALMFIGVFLFSIRWSPRQVPQDAFIGVGFALASASAMLLVASSPRGEAHLLDLLRGEILTVGAWDVGATAIGLGIVALIHFLFLKEILFTSFDPETASAFGYSIRFWEAVLYVTLGLTIALGIHATGVLFTSGCLVIPAAAALLISRKFAPCAIIAITFGIVPVPLGLYLSFVRDVPASAAIVTISSAALVTTAFVRKGVSLLQPGP